MIGEYEMSGRAQPRDGDMAGRDVGASARVLGAVAWSVEVEDGCVRATHAERPTRVLCLLLCTNRRREESLSRHARG